MKTLIVFFLMFVVSIESFTQNLIMNSSFEDVLSYNLTPYQRFDGTFNAIGWYSTIVNDEARFMSTNYPERTWPKIPSVFAAIDGLYSAHSGNNCIRNYIFNVNGWVGYITASIEKALEKDSLYELCLYAKSAKGHSGIFVNRIEAKFHQERKLFPELVDKSINLNAEYLYYNRYKSRKIYADVKMPLVSVNNDSSWVLICGTYKAKGGEKFVTLGVFYNDSISISKMLKYGNRDYSWKKEIEELIKKEERTRKLIKKDKNNLYYLNTNYVNKNNYTYGEAIYFIDDVDLHKTK